MRLEMWDLGFKLWGMLLLLALVTGCNKSQESTKIEITINDETVAKGKELYLSNCAMCHGQRGDGEGFASTMLKPKPRNHTDKKYMESLSNERLFSIIKNGGAVVGMPTMPASPRLSDKEIKNVIAFMRSIAK